VIRAPFLENPSSWLIAARRGYDPVRYATAIEVGHRSAWWWLARLFK